MLRTRRPSLLGMLIQLLLFLSSQDPHQDLVLPPLFPPAGVLAGSLEGFQDALGGLLGAFLGLFGEILSS